jgi:hypothetical protein
MQYTAATTALPQRPSDPPRQRTVYTGMGSARLTATPSNCKLPPRSAALRL